ncbi:MAG: response regulator [Oscillospiraceae bacterium]|nr:response regulator [Oscillospiraceae bacterium]
MTYSIIGILATVLLLITNRELFWNRENKAFTETKRDYRRFLLGALAYLVTDMLWGILESYKLTPILYADTALHFLSMAAAVMLWTRYVISYLGQKNAFATFLSWAGQLFLCFEAVVVILNFFRPVLFWFDAAGTYYAGAARYVTLAIQILLFLLTSVYTLWITAKTEGAVRHRHLTIGLFGIAMGLCIAVQVFYPLLPFYAMGYMLGTCLLHSFVTEDEKEEYRRSLEEAVAREKIQKAELAESREALQDALASAEHANRAKTAFLSNMSHEIRTPMNAIIGLNNIAMNDPTASDKVKEYLEKIGASAQHLLGIINDILDMSRIESGRMTVKQEEFSFSKGLEQVNTMISGQCRDKGLRYDCRITGRVNDYYIGDIMKLKQVLINILGNAVKFTPEGGAVRLVIEEGPHFDRKATLKFVISDTGIGMSKEYLPHIFEAFSQEDASSTSRYGSTGLGMPITKSIVELMNGHIEVQSEKGKGSVFTVTVTLGESDRKSVQTNEGDLDPHELSVLVIDDDRVALEHAEIVLGQIGIGCETAESGWEGVDKVRIRHGRREDYDLILIDWRMPEMDGVETTRQIRSLVGNDTPIIILTSFNWDDIAEEAKAAGVDTFVAKPLFAGSVMDEFQEAFRRKNELLERKTADLKGKRVLLAEDVAINAEIILMVLSMREMEADLAENGRAAVELFESHAPGYYDAILMDMRMPEMDGLEATRRIRSMDRSDAKTVPIIALTANAFDEDVQRSMQAGLNAHLSKPVEPDALFETLEALI